MNRKGIDYAVWLMMVVIICVVYLYIQIQGQLDTFQIRVGESQVALLNAYQDGEAALAFTDVAARYSVQRALYSLASRPGGCGESDGYPLWNRPDAPKQSCVPLLFKNLETFVNAEMDSYVTSLDAAKKSIGNYRMLFNGTDAVGVALAPIELFIVPPPERKDTYFWFFPIAQETYYKAVIGKYAIRPSFRVKAGYDFEALAKLSSAVDSLLTCAGDVDVPRCLDNSIPAELPTLKRTGEKGNVYYFRMTQPALKPYNEEDLVFGFALTVPASLS